MRFLCGCIVVFVVSVNCASADMWDSVKKGANSAATKFSGSPDRAIRAKSNFALNGSFSPVNVPFPMAWGASAYFVANADWMLGVDYLTSEKAIKFFSFEVGKIQERSYTIQARKFIGNSFNFKMGFGQRQTEARLAKNLFDLVTKEYSLIASEFKTEFVRLGIGNQWQFKRNITLAIDWISIDIPVSGEVETSSSQFAKSAESKEDIEDAENILKYYPGGSVIKFDIGVMF